MRLELVSRLCEKGSVMFLIWQRVLKAAVGAIVVGLVLAGVAHAQGATGIAGTVTDTTGSVLPGVTVEVSSPALIEKVRSAVTDGNGEYKILELRPGTYSVIFTLPGFNTVRRDGVVLTTSFTASVSAELPVGALEETVTVSADSPLVDVQNVVQNRVLTADVIEAVPSGRSMQALAALIPGMTLGAVSRPSAQDVGGSAAGTPNTLAIHGGRLGDMQELVDGMPQNSVNAINTGGITSDLSAASEYSYELGAISAEGLTGGVRVNMIPRDGGNQLSGASFVGYTNGHLQSNNTSDELLARGLGAINSLDKNWDLNQTFGGPIKRDKLWFYLSGRYWGSYDNVAGMWFNKTPNLLTYAPDLDRRAVDDTWRTSLSLRLTWQVNAKNKITAFALDQKRCTCHNGVSASVAPEASFYQIAPTDIYMHTTWTAPVTSRLMFEAGAVRFVFFSPRVAQPGLTPDVLSVRESSTNLLYRAAASYSGHDDWTNAGRASMAYVTGSHALKVGFTTFFGTRSNYTTAHQDVALTFLNGVPQSLTQFATPVTRWEKLDGAIGLYAQDQWTIGRLTANLGVRYDHHESSVPAQVLEATRFLPARTYEEVKNVPNWHDISPRLGFSYDFFGTGKTAVKVTLSRYVVGETLNTAAANNPVNLSPISTTRTWTSPSGSLNPFTDCDLTNPNPNGTCGAVANRAFGTPRITRRYDPETLSGWFVRPYQWEMTASVNHELRPGVAATAGYFRRWFGNFTITDNLAVTPADYDPYCVTVPSDPRLPGGGGSQLCGLYDIVPSKFGQVDELVTSASTFGKQRELYNGADVTVSARLRGGTSLQGGLNVGRTETDSCFIVDSPQLLNCNVKPPWQPQVKFLGNLPLPWTMQVSGSFQTAPGPEITAPFVVRSADVRLSLGRNLAAGANGTATVPLVPPGTIYDTRLSQLDVRFSKIMKYRGVRIQTNLDLYNALNGNAVLVVVSQYGPSWLQPSYVLPGRMLKIGASVNF
jgi:hypothetical protein